MWPYGQKVFAEDPSMIEEYWFSNQFVEDMKLTKEWADLVFRVLSGV